ncbi:hypothetical protein VTL71DRAFT_12494 [Oculimacula yallundae]|uniref:DUF7580 domain-containing protein n=1 Tax=Oculimacula yallundae TaxID=86028 RepID=A0ABR4CMQ9_9HELO
MSGLEVVGVVLGVLPLLISAAEHYEDVFKPFKRFKKAAPELELYQQQLKTQKTIFRNQCQLLLTALISQHLAKEMLKEKDHPSWQDDTLKKRIVEQLGSSREACEATVEMIVAKLKSIEEDAEDFGIILQESIPLRSFGDKAWRSRIQKKLKFCFSESRLSEYLDDLRKLNQDFRTLAKQTGRLDKQTSSSVAPNPVTAFPPQKVKESRLIQRASAQLYDAIGIACQSHTEHYAHFQLLPKNVNSTDTEEAFVRFNIAFTHDQTGALATLEPVWIAVDSSFLQNTSTASSQSIIQPGEPSSLSQALGRTLAPASPHPRKKLKTQKTVRFMQSPPTCSMSRPLTSQPQQTCSGNSPTAQDQQMKPPCTALTSKPSQHSSLPDFCIQHDFCHQLRKSCTYSRSPENKYIGYFQKSGPCKHLVYFAAPVAVHNYTQPESLAAIIGLMARKAESEQFLEYERLRLATRLAEAVLQFHATPLLKGYWHSDDVIFFRNGKPDDSASISSPHLNVQVGSTKSPKSIAQDSQDVDNVTGHMIRNPYLFSLGVVLIELAFQAPLRSLYNTRELNTGQFSALSDFIVASRLSKTISSSLGPMYGKVVRKCLGCDFGQGTTDLSDEKLQAAVYQDVVCELEKLERGFALLQLG